MLSGEKPKGSILSKTLKKVLASYHSLIEQAAKLVDEVEDENDFLTEGFVEAKLQELIRNHKKIQDKIAFFTEKAKISELVAEDKAELDKCRQESDKILEGIAFYKSLTPGNVGSTLDLLERIHYKGPLVSCLKGIQSYEAGDYGAAEQYLRDYFGKDPDSSHFLALKILARICAQQAQWHQAKRFAMRGIYLKPEDLELHSIMREAHKRLGEHRQAGVEDEIINLLKEG